MCVAGCDSGIQVLGDSTRLKRNDPVPHRSPFFDGKTLRLRGARGEVLGVQVLGAPAALLAIDGITVERFGVRALPVREPSTSMYGPSRGRGDYPDILEPNAERATFFDVYLARAGVHRGRLSVGAREFPVEVTVERVTIELQKDPLAWVFYLPKEIARAHGVPDDDGAAELEWEAKYHALFRAHGAYLAADLPRARFFARRRFADGIRYWPVALDLDHVEDDTREWLALFRDLAAQPFAIPVDEPKAKDFARVKKICDAVKSADRDGRLLCAVTAPRNQAMGEHVDVFLDGSVGGWRYNGGLTLDAAETALRSWGWIAFRDRLQLWYAWEGLYFSDRYNGRGPTDVLTNPLTFDQRPRGDDWGNGDGVLAYPGRPSGTGSPSAQGSPGPWPSLRLKTLRRGLQDRLLLLRLARCDEARAREIGSRIPRDEVAFEAARQEILDEIVRRCPDAQ